MRIGELSRKTGTSARAIRHYERFGLVVSRRAPNGYREFDEESVERVRRVRDLLGQGLGMQDIRALTVCFDGSAGRVRPCQVALDRYAGVIRALDRRIETLVSARDRAREGLAALRRRAR